MNKIVSTISCTSLFLFLFVSFCWATDFSNMSDKEFLEMRSDINSASQEERLAYQAEWEKRIAKKAKEKNDPQAGKSEGTGEMKMLWTPGQGYEPEGSQGIYIYGGTFKGTGKPEK